MYICDCCNYSTGRRYNFNLHLNTDKHKKNISKKPDGYVCKVCNYNTTKKYNYEKHLKTVKHINNSSVDNEKCKYNCKRCDFHTTRKTDYDRHIKSMKHGSLKKKTHFCFISAVR